jgi:transposase
MTIDKKRRVFVRSGYTDMRKQINGLARIVQDHDSQGPFSGSYYLFMGKTRRSMKILYWDTTGFCLWQKRLEDDSFPWPKDSEEISEITREQVLLLLRGLDIWREHQEKKYTSVG